MNAVVRRAFAELPLGVAAKHVGGKASVTIEQLLHWAYAEELVHLALPDGVPVELSGGRGGPKLASNAGLGAVPVDSSVLSGFVAAPDAYAVHWAVQDLGVIDLVLPLSVCPVWRAERWYLRESDDRGRIRIKEMCGLPVDFERRFRVDAAAIVVEAALQGRCPDWVREPVIVLERGKAHTDKSRHYKHQDVSFVGDMPWQVERARMTYRAWVSALAKLQDILTGRLRRFELSCALPKAMPWTDLFCAKT